LSATQASYCLSKIFGKIYEDQWHLGVVVMDRWISFVWRILQTGVGRVKKTHLASDRSYQVEGYISTNKKRYNSVWLDRASACMVYGRGK